MPFHGPSPQLNAALADNTGIEVTRCDDGNQFNSMSDAFNNQLKDNQRKLKKNTEQASVQARTKICTFFVHLSAHAPNLYIFCTFVLLQL